MMSYSTFTILFSRIREEKNLYTLILPTTVVILMALLLYCELTIVNLVLLKLISLVIVYLYQKCPRGHIPYKPYLIDIDVKTEDLIPQHYNRSHPPKPYLVHKISIGNLQVNLRDGWCETSAVSTVKVFIPEIKEVHENSKLLDFVAFNYRLEQRSFCCLDPRIQTAIICSHLLKNSYKVTQIKLQLHDCIYHFRAQKNRDDTGWELTQVSENSDHMPDYYRFSVWIP